jgi:hypothetical protein
MPQLPEKLDNSHKALIATTVRAFIMGINPPKDLTSDLLFVDRSDKDREIVRLYTSCPFRPEPSLVAGRIGTHVYCVKSYQNKPKEVPRNYVEWLNRVISAVRTEAYKTQDCRISFLEELTDTSLEELAFNQSLKGI